MAVSLKTGYVPRPLQRILHASMKRFNVIVAHRRFGKSVFTINHILHKALKCSHTNPQYAYIAPTYKQVEMIAWEYMKEYTKKMPGVKYNNQKLTVTIDRPSRPGGGEKDKVKIMLLGVENKDSLRGLYLDGAVLDEYAQYDPTVWSQILRPALSDRLGWGIFIGTPNGRNDFYKKYIIAKTSPDWYEVLLDGEKTGVLPPSELADLKRTMSDEDYEQEIRCSFNSGGRGSYYGSFLTAAEDQGRITDVPYNPAYPVDTYWDLGISDSCAIWFRQRLPGGKLNYIDYYEETGKGIKHYADEIRKKSYSFGRHVLPWDANTKELGTGVTVSEVLRGHGFRHEIQKRQSVQNRIEASRLMLPISYFDTIKCEWSLDALRNYTKVWDEQIQAFSRTPKKDWTSHAADSYGYSAFDTRPSSFANDYGKDLQRQAMGDYNELGD